MQPTWRSLYGRCAGFLLILTVLSLPWPGLARSYCEAVGKLAESILTTGLSPVRWNFAPANDNGWHLRIHAEDPATGRFVETELDVRRAGYLASAVFTALTLATPLTAAKKVCMLFGGLAFLQLLPFVPVLSFFSGKLPVQAFHFGAIGHWMIEIAYHSLIAAPGMAYALPAMLWSALLWMIDSRAFSRHKFADSR